MSYWNKFEFYRVDQSHAILESEDRVLNQIVELLLILLVHLARNEEIN
jgi:hypothetical protein